MEAHEVLEKVSREEMSVGEAEAFFRREPFEDMGYAKLDTHRKLRNGAAEVVFCSGKADDHLVSIFQDYGEQNGEVLEPELPGHSMNLSGRNFRNLHTMQYPAL